jgi:hypothetical protein
MDTRQSFRSVFTGEMLEQVSIYCTSCSAEISHYPGDLSMCRESVIELCIDAWNNRAAIDRIEALTAENERLKREVLLQMGWKTEAQSEADTLAADLNYALGDNSRLREALEKIAAECWVTAGTALMEEGARLALEAAEVLFQQYGWHGVTKKLDPTAIVKGKTNDRD